MKIKKQIQNILSKEKVILLTKLTIEEEKHYVDSPLNNIIPIKLKDFKKVKCFWCKNIGTNFCWNCKKPHCDKHSRAIYFPPLFLINTFCLECAKECEKLGKDKLLNQNEV